MAKKTDQEQREIYSKLTDWQKSEQYPQMEYSETGKLFWCPIHIMALTANTAANHNKTCQAPTGPNTHLEKLAKLKERLDDENGLGLVPTPEQMVLEDHNKEIAEAASMLAKDYELRAEFEMLHQQKLIPWDWTFYDWIKIGCVHYWNGSFGFELKLTQDTAHLTKEQIAWIHETLSENLEHEKSTKEDSIL